MRYYRIFTGKGSYGRKPIPKWDGGEDQHGNQHKPVWPKIAQFILNIGADVETFVEAQFLAPRVDRSPYPTSFYNDAAIARYHQYQRVKLPDIADRFRAELLSITTTATCFIAGLQWSEERAVATAVCDQLQVVASPLTRYFFGVAAGCAAVVEPLRVEAFRQYMSRKAAYDAAVGEWVPDYFKRGESEPLPPGPSERTPHVDAKPA